MQNMVQKMEVFHFDHLLILLFFCSFQLQLSVESDSILPGQTLAGNRTLTSSNGFFEMGFFALPGNSHGYYIGIWYKGLPLPEKTVVWVANREHPVPDPYTSRLELGEDGNLVLRSSSGVAVWSTNSTSSEPPSNATVGTLGDDGNFVILKDNYIWQSFEHPTDTLLPYASFGNYNGIKTVLTSWKGSNNPGPGLFSLEVHKTSPYLFEVQMLLKNGSSDSKFCLYGEAINHEYSKYGYISYDDSSIAIVAYSSYPAYCLVRYVLDVTGQPRLLVWSADNWHMSTMPQQETCHSPSGRTREERGNKGDITKKAERSGIKNATWIAIVASALLALLFIGIIVIPRIMRREDSGSSFEATGGDILKHYNHRDLQMATKNFTQKIGKGGFSNVYKGELPDSTFIAVKELKGLLQEDKQLRAELNTLGLIQHRNLVHLRGFCLENSKRFIVYDYMPNGSLESHLFQTGSNILDWGRRYNIALGTAKGLAYLHEGCRDCIIHCDIKPENILLDAMYDPKVADFGLAKALHRNFSRVLTTMRGTRGYLAPEWFSGEPITAKVDIYSYGQVLFEIIAGRRNMDLLNNELHSYFPALVLNALNKGEEVQTLADSKLKGELNEEELNRACKVACWCIQDHEKDRPTMTQVVQILEGLLDVATPPIPRFFQSIAEASMKESEYKGSEAYSTPSTQPTSFTFQPPAKSIQLIP